uniref:hypothetical protein n=1 Tax=Paractinoplanes polyasparticus TaxID=2856853 RepID=UPI001C85AF20|nr:hypothetical protein [Actinoplanes polyasparticus]
MARLTYGGGANDIIVTDATINGTLVAALPSAQTFSVWNLANSVQLTSILSEAGAALPSNLVTSSSVGQIPVFQGPDGYTGPLRLRHTGTSVSWILEPRDTSTPVSLTTIDAKGDLLVGTAADTIARVAVGSNGQVLAANSALTAGVGWVTPAAGGTATLPNTLVVAANGSGITGDYQCDGTADEVQINQALTALRGGAGGTVLLTAGTYNLAAPILIEGFDDVNIEQDLYLRGQGPTNTTLDVASGISCGIRLGRSVRAHVWDLGLETAGASDGIQAVASAVVPAGGYRSAWLSSIMRVQVIGPFDGTDTGWALDLDNMFRATIQDVEVNGTTNGMRFSSSNSAFNPGDMTVNRCFVDIGNGGNNGAAYHFDSVAGQVNQMAMITCHSIGNPAATGTVAWKFTGGSAHMRLMNCNVEQFATTAQVGSSAYDIDLDFVHVTMRNGSTLADLDGYGCRVRCGLAYVEPAATITLVDDDNGYNLKPNVFGPVDVYADTGSTVNADTADTLVLRDVTYDGPGTVAAVVKQPTAVQPTKVVNLTDAATIATNASLGDTFRVTITAARTFGAPTNPTDGQRILYEVGANGAYTPVFATGAGAFVVSSGAAPAATAAGSFDTFDCVYSAPANRWRVLTRTRTTA